MKNNNNQNECRTVKIDENSPLFKLLELAATRMVVKLHNAPLDHIASPTAAKKLNNRRKRGI